MGHVSGQADLPRMLTSDALQVLVDRRRDDEIIVTNQGSSREWPKLADHPLDFHYLPSAMGAAIPLALGLALAQPRREVTVVSGDGALLMNLGALVTVCSSTARNLSVIVLDNGVYAVTGMQKTPAADPRVDFAGLASAAGFENVWQFSDCAEWRERSDELFAEPGPRFVWIRVKPQLHVLPPAGLPPLAQRLNRFREALLDAKGSD